MKYPEQTFLLGEEEAFESLHVAQPVPLVPVGAVFLAERKNQFEFTITLVVVHDTCVIHPYVFVEIIQER